MAKKMRDKIRSFADTFNYNTNTPPHTITRYELMESTLFLNSMPNEFSFSVSGANTDNLIDVYESFRRFTNSSEKLSKELETAIFSFFCYVYFKIKEEEKQDLIDSIKFNILPNIPNRFYSISSEIVENEETFKYYSHLFSTQKYICKCSESTAIELNHFINRPENSQLRSIITSFLILEKENDPVPHYSYSLRLMENSQSNLQCNNLNIIKAEVRQSTLASGSINTNTLYYIRDEQNVYQLNNSTRQSHKIYAHPASITTISASSQSSVVFTGDIAGNAKLWSKTCFVTLPQSTTSTWSSDFAPSGGFFAFGSADKIVRLFDTPRHLPIRYLIGHTEDVTDIKFHHNCFFIATCAFDSTIRIWDPREAKSVRLWISQSGHASSPTFSWDGAMIAFSESPNKVIVGDLATSGKILQSEINGISEILSIYFSIDNKYIYIIGKKGEIFSLSIADSKKDPDIPNEKSIKKLICNLNSNAISSSMNFSNELLVITSKSEK